MNNPWTLYLPDGSRVTGGNAPERIYDRNNNYVQINNLDNYNYQNSNHQAVQLVDQLNRAVTLVYRNQSTNEDAIISQGFGEELVTKVRWSSANVGKTYWPCPEAGGMSCQTHDSGQQQTPDNFFVGLGVVDRITLPSQAGNLFYTFSYNAPTGGPWPPAPSTGWGELSGITLPSGAQASYHYLQDGDPNGILSTPDVLQNSPTQKDLTYAQEYDGASNNVTETWTYSTSDPNGMGTITSPDGGVTTEYSFSTNNQPWNAGLVYKSVHPDGSKTERLWAQNHIAGYGPDNPYVKTEFTSIKSGSNYVKTAIKDYNYDKNGNVTNVREYDWLDYASVPRNSYGDPTGIPFGAVPARVTTNNYYAATADASQTTTNGYVYWFQSSPLLKNAVASTELSDGSGNVRSRTELTYDYPLTTGNLIQKASWDSTKGAYTNQLTADNSISVSMQYNQYGSPTQTTDARGTLTVLTYGNVGGVTDLYPTQTVTASGTSIARTETRSYDFATGLVTSATDYDNNVTTSTGHDVFGRPTLVKSALGKPEETRTRTEYDDVLRRVIVHSDLNTVGDEKLVSIQHYDQLGRVGLSRQLEDSTNPDDALNESIGIKVQTRYLFSGSNSYTLSSNPYRASTSGGASSEGTMGWTRSKTDNSGRMVEMQTFGGSSLPPPWGPNSTSTGTVTTAYDANFATVTDQALRMRRSMTNGLGQLVRVDEPGDPNTNNSLGTSDNPAQPTSYDYDVLGNLLHVYQGSQTRTFTYSSLARLLTATNPESGTICYGTVSNGQCQANGYDENGNLVYKTDARGVQANYVYDRLNRATSRSYSDGTPTVTYSYDTVTNYGKGRLASVSSSVSSYSYSAYDALGRALGGTETISSHDYSITNVAYDRAGHVTSMTYPSGNAVTFNYDTAGRLGDKDSSHLAFTGNLGDGTTRTYTKGITYAPGGQMTQEQFGTTTAVYNKLSYNTRGQLVGMMASTSGNDTSFNRGKIVNDYGTTDNNGNLKQQTTYVPNNDQNTSPTSWYQQYGYDSLNRLTQVHEYTGNTNLDWQQAYTYDRFGNRTINNNSNATWGDGINNVLATIDQSNNRMLAVNDPNHNYIDYDAAGNQTKDYLTSSGTRTYDAENRMISATDSSNHTSTYSYDGDGHRVKRNISGTETWQVYGLGGELIAEYAQNQSAATPQKEYGYRNGQLLVTATVTTGWGSAPTIHDNPLFANQTTIQALHITELRTAINSLRSHLSLSAYSWQYSAITADYISANPILEMRTALDQALGTPSGGYVAGLAQGQPVKAIHIQELRDRVLAAWQSSSGVDIRWMVSDQLGTPRMIFDQTGSLANVSRHDCLPFGEELSAGSRSAQLGYTNSDGARQKFTSKERDAETGLDYFGARYYSSFQGRFSSVDPALSSGDVGTPQSWNRYVYSFSNPLRYIDPTGAWNWSAELGGSASDAELRGKAGKDKKALKAAAKIIETRDLFRSGLNAAGEAGSRSDEPDAVVRAVNAYGSERDSNGVTVTVGETTNGTAAEAGASATGALSPDGTTAQVLVTINQSVSNVNELAQAIGHEGWHVADRQSFARYLSRQMAAVGGAENFSPEMQNKAYDSAYNRTVQTTEFNAYIVSGLIAQGRDAISGNLPNSNFKGHEVWNRNWSAAERPGLRAVGAFEHVTSSSIYAGKLKDRLFPQ
jgi:RHS repeat-associated protein